MANLSPGNPARPLRLILMALSLLLSLACGGPGSSGGSGGGGGGQQPPATPTGLTATPGDQQVSLTWNGSSGASSYHIKRAATSGGPYTQVATTTANNDIDASLTNGTKYFYVVSAANAAGEGGSSTEVSATPSGAATNIQATIDVLSNRHLISPYVYGGAFPESLSSVTDSGTSVVRWGGNASSTYHWQLHTYNADNDYFFENFNFYGMGDGNNATGTDASSTQFITDVKSAGSAPLMTMVMLPWVAKSAETPGAGGNGHWSFSVAKYGAQCATDQYNSDAGNGQKPATCNSGSPAYFTADPNDAYYPIVDDHNSPCSAGSNCVYRSDWAAALASAFGSSPHFYDMDNEIDIWGGTHLDVHPNPTSFGELRDTYLTESRALKAWDPLAIRFGPVSCCWYFYWRSATGASDTTSHGGVDFLPWWLNEVSWSDAVANARSLDVFDIHAYPDGPDTSSFTKAQKQALAARIYRDWWDPTYTSEASYIANGGFSIEPLDGKPFRIPRMRALVNQIYPQTQFSVTEWSAAFAGESDFSTAIGDADAYGILGRERVYLATRWVAPVAANANYEALKLFTNYDGSHHGFGTTSVAATHNGDPDLFSIYAALSSTGTSMSILVLNKDLAHSAQVQIATHGFTPTKYTTYTLSQSSPTTIVVGTSQAWSSTQTFGAYSATLLVLSGNLATPPASEWDLNPDSIMVPANGSVTLNPTITKGTSSVTLSSAVFDGFEGSSACTGGSLTLITPTITTTTSGEITVNAPSTPGFCHFTITGTDGAATQTQGGWIVVGNPAATLAKTSGDGQTGTHGTQLPQALKVTLSPGQSGGTATGVTILFSTNGGSLSNGTTSGVKVMAVTNNAGAASVTLTLPSTAQVVTITAEGPYGLGHPQLTFTETSQ
jgi:Glycoside hydrolase family 44